MWVKSEHRHLACEATGRLAWWRRVLGRQDACLPHTAKMAVLLRQLSVIGLYLERGTKDSLARGTRKSCEREIAGLYREPLSLAMKTSESSTASDDPFVPASNHRSFPLRTLMVCCTIWLIATEVLVFDQIKFNAKTELLEQATRAIRGQQLVLPTERASHLPGDAKMEKL